MQKIYFEHYPAAGIIFATGIPLAACGITIPPTATGGTLTGGTIPIIGKVADIAPGLMPADRRRVLATLGRPLKTGLPRVALIGLDELVTLLGTK